MTNWKEGFPWENETEFKQAFKDAQVFFNYNPSKVEYSTKKKPPVTFIKPKGSGEILALGYTRERGELICNSKGIVWQRGFPWLDKNEREKAFLEAEKYFEKYPTESKFRRKRRRLFVFKKETSVSFIKKVTQDGKSVIRALARSDLGGQLGEGGFGKVKITMDKDGHCYAEKIELGMREDSGNEHSIGQDQSLFLDEAKMSRETNSEKSAFKNKSYSSMIKGATTLNKELINQSLTLEQRIQRARQLCWAVAMLHSGESSKTKTPTVHADIKPENILLDEQGRLRLADFGFSSKNIEKLEEIHGTDQYLPISKAGLSGPNLLSFNMKRMGPINVDLFALKRSLITHECFIYDRGNIIRDFWTDFYNDGLCIFSKDEFEKFPKDLKEMIDTLDVQKAVEQRENDTPLKLTLYFIALEVDKLSNNDNPLQFDAICKRFNSLPETDQPEICRIFSLVDEASDILNPEEQKNFKLQIAQCKNTEAVKTVSDLIRNKLEPSAKKKSLPVVEPGSTANSEMKPQNQDTKLSESTKTALSLVSSSEALEPKQKKYFQNALEANEIKEVDNLIRSLKLANLFKAALSKELDADADAKADAIAAAFQMESALNRIPIAELQDVLFHKKFSNNFFADSGWTEDEDKDEAGLKIKDFNDEFAAHANLLMPDLNKSVEVFRTLSTLSAELKNPLVHDQALLSSFKDMILGPNDSAELNKKLNLIVQCCQGIEELKQAKIGNDDPLMEECIDLHTRKLLKNSTDGEKLEAIHTDIKKSYQSATSQDLQSYLDYIEDLKIKNNFLKTDPKIKADFLQQALKKIPVNLRDKISTSNEPTCLLAKNIRETRRCTLDTNASLKKRLQKLTKTSHDNNNTPALNSTNSTKRTLN